MVGFAPNSYLGMRAQLIYVLIRCVRDNDLKHRGCGMAEAEAMGSLEFIRHDDTHERGGYTCSILHQNGPVIF